jgi:hypothetical protein
MAEDQKNKAGLRREASSVFKGVPIPQNGGSQQPSEPASQRTGDTHPKPSSAGPKKAQSPNPYQFTQSLRKSTFAKQPAVDTFVETTNQSILQRIKDRLFAPKPGVSPTRQKAMIILVPILAIIMIFIYRQLLSSAPDKTEGAPDDDLSAPVAVNDSGGEIDWKIPEPYPTILRDPIKLSDGNAGGSGIWSDTTNKTVGELNVRGIIYSVDRPSAVVGDQIVHISEKVDDIIITKIDREWVEFKKDGKTWIQKVGEKGEELNEEQLRGQDGTKKKSDEEK